MSEGSDWAQLYPEKDNNDEQNVLTLKNKKSWK